MANKSKNTNARDSRYFINSVAERGGSLPDFIAAFSEVGIKLDRTAVVDFPCPSCGSVHVSATDSLGRERDSMFYHLIPSGSSLRLHNADPVDSDDGLARHTTWTLECGSGPSCDYVMTSKEFLTMALAAVGASTFADRVRPIQTDAFPVNEKWCAVYLPHNKARGVFMSPRSPERALLKLEPGCGVRVLLQEVLGISEKDATSNIEAKAWVDCVTSETGALLRPADIVARDLAEKQAKEDAELEAEISVKLSELEADLRRRPSN
jgi:hypothetical protein